MASSFPRLLSRHLLSSSPPSPLHRLPLLLSPARFLTTTPNDSSNPEPEADFDPNADTQKQQESPRNESSYFERPLEGGIDQGFYKAIMVGKVGQKPVQKRLKSGKLITLFSVGTGGMRNNRRPLDDEEPQEYASRCVVQWHRVCVYPERLALLAMKNINIGSVIYLEGNLETKVFSDPISGIVRRIREIAIRRDGRFMLINEGGNEQNQPQIKGVGYF